MGVRSSRPLRAGATLSDLDLDVALRCAICAERALGEKSQWHGYFRSLLRSNEPLPYLWSCPERQLLLGTDAYATVEETLELLREEFREHQQLLHSPPLHEVTITEEDYLHAATLASSRAFTVDDFHLEALVPFADVFNHRCQRVPKGEAIQAISGAGTAQRRSEATCQDVAEVAPFGLWRGRIPKMQIALAEATQEVNQVRSGTGPTGQLMIYVLQDLAANVEIFNTYGEFSNDKLLQDYGFILESSCEQNAFNTVTLPRRGLESPRCAWQLRWAEKHQKQLELLQDISFARGEGSDEEMESEGSEEEPEEGAGAAGLGSHGLVSFFELGIATSGAGRPAWPRQLRRFLAVLATPRRQLKKLSAAGLRVRQRKSFLLGSPVARALLRRGLRARWAEYPDPCTVGLTLRWAERQSIGEKEILERFLQELRRAPMSRTRRTLAMGRRRRGEPKSGEQKRASLGTWFLSQTCKKIVEIHDGCLVTIYDGDFRFYMDSNNDIRRTIEAHYTGIDGLIESVPASLEERRKKERKGLRKNQLKKRQQENRRETNPTEMATQTRWGRLRETGMTGEDFGAPRAAEQWLPLQPRMEEMMMPNKLPDFACGEAGIRLTLEDFASTPSNEAFDAVAWLNHRLSRSSLPMEKLDQHLASLSMSCQLLCQDTSESIELASNQLVSQLSSAGPKMETMRQEASKGYGRLGDVLEGLKDADDRKRSGLKGLAEIDVVKTRVETACNALREVGSWERKVKDCEQMVHSGNLGEALGQLKGLQGVLDAFRMLPEFARKSEQLSQLEEQLLFSARRRARSAFEKNSPEELRVCSEVRRGAERLDDGLLASIANGVLLDLCERAWNSQGRAPSSPGDVAAAASTSFQALTQALDERWPLLQALEAEREEETGTGGDQVTAAKAALGALSQKLLTVLDGRDADELSRASMAVGLLGVYVDGLGQLCQLPALQHRWSEVCSPAAPNVPEVLPWPLLREIVRFVLLRPMEDDAAALAPSASSSLRPSEAVLTAESNATRLLQMPSTWRHRLESQGASQLAVPWLACVDETNGAYWRQWEKLIEVFENTLRVRSAEALASGASGFDSAFLQEVMQLHSVLHENLQNKFTNFQADVMQQVGHLRSSQSESAFSTMLQEKMKEICWRDPSWRSQLGIPSEASLRSATDFLEGSAGTSGVLPSAAAALGKIEVQVRALVTRCCAEPVTRILQRYPEMPEWTLQDEAAHGPLQCITLVPEHLFSLMPQLESQDLLGVLSVLWLDILD
eukprot:g25851.t1